MTNSTTSPSRSDVAENESITQSNDFDYENASKKRKMNASELMNSNYRDLGSPPDVGQRFLNFLLHNQNFDNSGLLRIIQLDHERITNHNNGSRSNPNNVNVNNGTQSNNQKIQVANINAMRMRQDVSLSINAWELIQYDYELGDMLLRFPTTLLPLLEEAAIEALKIILRKTLAHIYNSSQNSHGKYHPPLLSRVNALLRCMHQPPNRNNAFPQQQQRQWKIHARIINLPPTHTCCKPSISSIQARDIGKIVQISGTVVRITPVQMLEVSRAYQCAKCKHIFCIYADFQQFNNALPLPTTCPTNNSNPRCNSTTFDSIPHQAINTDYQEIKVQESGNALAPIPRSILCKLQHDLVDSCQPGDDVFVVGSLIAQWQPVVPNIDCSITMALHAHSIKVMNGDSDGTIWDKSSLSSNVTNRSGKMRDKYRKEFEQFWNNPINRTQMPITARNFICKAVCPKLYGMITVKIALLLTLIGGASLIRDESSNYDSNHQSERKKTFVDVQHASDNENDRNESIQHDDNNDESYYSEPEEFCIDLPSDDNSKNKPYEQSRRDMKSTQKDKKNHNPPQLTKKCIRNKTIQTKRRAESHILLVGDPGTGKSQFLRFAAALSPRSVLTTGVGTTSAGLTCAAVRDGNNGSKQYTLEAGALVLADRGVCCIDEFGCIREEDRAAIHEAMEQQTISVAKAGIVCKLNSRATVVAVMNPKGVIYATSDSLSKNTNISSPLLSRFDFIFVLLDGAGVDGINHDKNISTFLLNHAITGEEKLDEEDNDDDMRTTMATTNSHSNRSSSCKSTLWSMDKLRAYIATVKERFQPTLSAEAARLLKAHYQRCRSSNTTSVNITVRFLESLIRLSQAHARLMYRNIVEREDAVAVILIMECSAATSAGLTCDLVDIDDNLFEPPMNCEMDSIEQVDLLFHEKMQKVLHRYPEFDENDDERNGSPKKSWDDDYVHKKAFSQNMTWQNVSEMDQPSLQGSQRMDPYGRNHFVSPGRSRNHV